MGDLAGDEGEGALDQREQRAVRRAAGVERIVVERHARVGDKVERGAVGEADADRGVGPGLHDVALVDRVADVKRDGNAVADDGDTADDLFDLADGVGGCGRLRLCVLPGRRRSGEEIDDVGSKTGAVRRYQRRVFFARKISRDDVMAAVGPGYDEIGAQTLVLTAKQQFRVGHPDVIGVARIEVDYRRTLPATPLIERERPTHPLAGL